MTMTANRFHGRHRRPSKLAASGPAGRHGFHMKSTSPKITLRTLADQLGVSTSTISRALQNNRTIHSDTRARVLAAAARLGYDRPSRVSPGRSGDLQLLLLLPPHLREGSTLVLPSYLRGITTGATALGCTLSVEEITDTQYSKMRHRAKLPRAVRNGKADVVILTGRHHPDDVSALAQVLPVVSIQWDYPSTRVDLVTAFNGRGVAELVAALAAGGHRRLAWVGAEYESSFFREREAGFIQGCLHAKIFPDPKMFLAAQQLDAARLRRLVAGGVTALVAANDDTAFKVAETCAGHGIRIPEDLSLTGFDASHLPLRNGKRLTGYDPSFVEIGQAAVELAVQRLRQPGANRMIQSREGWIVEGETARHLKNIA